MPWYLKISRQFNSPTAMGEDSKITGQCSDPKEGNLLILHANKVRENILGLALFFVSLYHRSFYQGKSKSLGIRLML